MKLHQFHPADRQHVRIDTNGAEGTLPLFADARETVRIENWEAGAGIDLHAPEGMEIFVLGGGFEEGGDSLATWDWLRLPPGSETRAVAGPSGARLWVKSGHLAEISMPA